MAYQNPIPGASLYAQNGAVLTNSGAGAACSSYGPVITRHMILFKGNVGTNRTPFLVRDVVLVNGLSMGDQGSVTLTQQDRIIEIPDGIRKLPELTLAFRFVRGNLESEVAKTRLFEWYDKRNERLYDIEVYITDRKWCPIHKWVFSGASIKNISENDKDIASPSLSLITASFVPYEVSYFDTLESILTFAR